MLLYSHNNPHLYDSSQILIQQTTRCSRLFVIPPPVCEMLGACVDCCGVRIQILSLQPTHTHCRHILKNMTENVLAASLHSTLLW